MYYVGTLNALMCNSIFFRVRMEKTMVTHNSIQLCVKMDTSNEQYVVMPINGHKHAGFGHEK